jgi:hypothetical protein
MRKVMLWNPTVDGSGRNSVQVAQDPDGMVADHSTNQIGTGKLRQKTAIRSWFECGKSMQLWASTLLYCAEGRLLSSPNQSGQRAK